MDDYFQLGVFAAEEGGVPVRTSDLPDAEAIWVARNDTVRQEPKVARGCARPVPPVEKAPEDHLGVSGIDGSELDDLTLTGWAVLYGPNTSQAIKDQLAPLVAWRLKGVCKNKPQNANLCRVFDGNKGGYAAGQSAEDWLRQFKATTLAQVNMKLGVPFYIMIVASPDDIPFRFQYDLDIYWGVGRLWLENVEDYGAYARAVIENESAEQVPTSRHITFFAPRFPNDEATKRTCDGLIAPLLPVGDDYKFTADLITSPEATRERLIDLYSGQTSRPAIYFCGSHGVKMNHESANLTTSMGSILCGTWDGKSAPISTQYVAGRDLRADTDLRGTMHILFACYACGWPKDRELDQTPIAPAPGIARLPQTLLAKGALAVFGHIDVVWSYSYQGDGGIDRSQEYEGILKFLMKGRRAGHATDSFNIRWNVMGEYIANQMRNATILAETARDLWIQHDDARNYVLYGDPAVRLRAEDMPASQRETNFLGAPATS